jgi:LysM domain-containing protein
MTERGLPIVEGPAACPFVAFVDDRDERATSPDHRHRCYAEATPAPRALAHQEAYCLSSAFPVCPTFQDWAKREAARATSDSGPNVGAPIPGLSDERPTGAADDEEVPVYEDRPRKPAAKDWKTPPPWIGRAEEQAGRGRGDEGGSDAMTAAGLGLGAAAAGTAGADGAAAGAAGGLSGSFADRLASPPEPPGRQRTPVWRTGDAWDDELDEHGNPLGRGGAPDDEPDEELGGEPRAELEEAPPRPSRRAREREQERFDDEDDPREGRSAPSWERPARLESFPSLRSRRMASLGIPTLALAAVAVLLAAVLLFFLPGFLGLGGGQSGGSPTPSTGAGASPSVAASVAPTDVAAPTQQIYLVQSGDTMSKIAKKFGVPLQVLIDANKTTIPNPDRLKIGDAVTIPAAVPSALPGTSAGASP